MSEHRVSGPAVGGNLFENRYRVSIFLALVKLDRLAELCRGGDVLPFFEDLRTPDDPGNDQRGGRRRQN